MRTVPVAVFFLLFLLLPVHTTSSATEEEYDRCEVALEAWAEGALQELADIPEEDSQELKELLFFLHVPRTGGRTYHQCLLRHLFPLEQHCDRSYDKLRFNSSKHCRLLVTHNDYSVLAKLPLVSTSVITNMRHPVDRIFSAYEFSVEVASRFLARTTQSKVVSLRANKRNLGSSTLDIWPWEFLVPWMRADLFSRRTARQSGELSTSLGDVHHYNASSFVMPLHEFIYQPMVMDLLHNGATFQLAGLTNNSYTKGAGYLRNCVIDHQDLGHHVLNVAKRRVDRMALVGLTDKQEDTAKLFAHTVGGQILPLGEPSINSSLEGAHNITPVSLTSVDLTIPPHEKSEQVVYPNNSVHTAQLTVYGLIEKYENCVGRLRETQRHRRVLSLQKVLPVNFSNEARRQVAEETLEAIRQLNNLDLELYNYAHEGFSKYQVRMEKNPQLVIQGWGPKHTQLTIDERLVGWSSPWSGSRKLMLLMLLSMGGGVVTIGIGLFIFFNGSRILKIHTRQNYAVHEKK